MMKILIMGTGGFIIPSLEILAGSEHEIVAAITMPLRIRKGAKQGTPPVRSCFERLALPFYEPEDINAPEGIALLDSIAADLFFVCDYGKILSPEVIAKTPYGGINLHGSLLPKYRGAAPINRAILAGEKELGVSILHITPEIDAGPVIACDSYVPSLDDTAVEIEDRLAHMGAPLVLDCVNQLAKGTARPIPQDASLACKAPKLKKEEGRIDWSQSAEQIINRYRAMQPWPKTFSDWSRNATPDKPPVRLILGPFQKYSGEPIVSSVLPGTVIRAQKDEWIIQTGDIPLAVRQIQPAGKAAMPPDAFLRGYRSMEGDCLS